MALNNNFYDDIFSKEKYWISLINQNLLNIYYLNGTNGLKEFYLLKKEELEAELSSSQNQILYSFLGMVNDILRKIDSMTEDYRQGKTVDFKLLGELFLTSQMNNTKSVENKNSLSELEMKKKVLEALRDFYKAENYSYIDDGFYDEDEKQKVA